MRRKPNGRNQNSDRKTQINTGTNARESLKKMIINKTGNQDGNTMVSVLVGFLLLMMIMIMLQQVINYCYKMMDRADQIRTETDLLTKEFYTGKQDQTRTADVLFGNDKKFKVVNEENSGDGFYFSFDLNQQYTNDTDHVSLFYFGKNALVTGGVSTP